MYEGYSKTKKLYRIIIIKQSVFLAAYFQWRIHQGHEQRLARTTLLLLAMRRELNGTALRAARRPPLLRVLLRIRLR